MIARQRSKMGVRRSPTRFAIARLLRGDVRRIAKEIGVSYGLVSMVLNGKARTDTPQGLKARRAIDDRIAELRKVAK